MGRLGATDGRPMVLDAMTMTNGAKSESFFTRWSRVIKGLKVREDKGASLCPKCGRLEAWGEEGERCCLYCGAHQRPTR